MSNPDDRYAGLTPEERAFREGFDAEDGAPPSTTVATEVATEDPPPAAGGEGVDTTEGGADPAPQDPLEALPEELRNRWMELESANRNYQSELERERAEKVQIRNDYAAVAGRLKPMQQRLAELERAQGQGQAAGAATDSQEQTEEVSALFEREDWKRYAATFPEEAKAFADVLTGAVTTTEAKLRKQIAHLEQRVSSIAPLVEQVVERERESEYERSLKVLTEPHPDYREINASPEFQQWLANEYPKTLPAMIRASMMDESFKRQVFSDPASVADILTQFKSTRQPAPSAPSASAPPASTPQAPAAPAKPDPRLALSAAPSVTTGGIRQPRLSDLTPEQQFRAGYEAG